jgi:glycerol-3-phosphate dehydrogenase
LPTAVTLAAEDRGLAERLRDRLALPTFRIYLSDDVAGAEIGGGRSAAELLSDRKTVAEGAFTAPVLARLARERGIDMPIVDAVDALIAGRANIDQVLEALLSRPPRSEGI